jgi:hypothetical protein
MPRQRSSQQYFPMASDHARECAAWPLSLPVHLDAVLYAGPFSAEQTAFRWNQIPMELKTIDIHLFGSVIFVVKLQPNRTGYAFKSKHKVP